MALPLPKPWPSGRIAKPTKLEPDYAPAFTDWQANPNPTTTGNLLRTIKPEIDRALHVYAGGSDPILYSKAKSITLAALPRYDSSQAKLGTFVMHQLHSLKRAARQQQQIINIPERVQMDSQMLHRTEAELSDKLGREPSSAELARRSGLSVKRIGYVRKFRFPVSESQMTQTDDEGNESVPGAVTTNEASNVWRQIVYLDAEPIEQKIMEWSFGMHGNPVLPNQEIARRLKLSPGAISQRKAQLQLKLDSETGVSPYG